MSKIIHALCVLAVLSIAGCAHDKTYNPHLTTSPLSNSYPCKMTVSITAEGKPVTITRTVRMHEYLTGGIGDTHEQWTQGVVWVQHRLPSGADIYLRVPQKRRPTQFKTDRWELGKAYYIEDPGKMDVIEDYSASYNPDRFAEDANITRSSCVAKYERIKGRISGYDTNDEYLIEGSSYYYEKNNIPFHSARYRVSWFWEIDPSYHAGLAAFLSTIKEKTLFTREQLFAGAKDHFAIAPGAGPAGDVWPMTPLKLQERNFTTQANKSGITVMTRDDSIAPPDKGGILFPRDQAVLDWLADKTITIFDATYPAVQLFERDTYLFNPETEKLYSFHFHAEVLHIVDTPPRI
ncbi:hypothetical protein BerOc1_00101 [Pseudodesulfovibrio hydrargyri]|uniref:Lipoprotein n=1 Tax=Pseudodesulfovibrio hydrargyri TaxID=2125990 RepID=A0A1J5MYW7_9BACT|nr:hypothetical protein [Pseudodesulfovibrio hydrargyri]OIQ51646.1 hypothetical protein BerOc1_00101 [Pseudodesulfovibrio hydrargyri]